MNAVEVTDEVTPEVFTPSKRKNPFGITAEPGSKLYHRQYTRAWLQQKRDEKKFQSRTLAHAVTQPRMGTHMTLRELSEAQGWPTDHNSLSSLRKRLEARQKLVGVVLLFKLSPRPAGRLYTTLPLLRRYASELFDEASEVTVQAPRRGRADRGVGVPQVIGFAPLLREAFHREADRRWVARGRGLARPANC